MSEVATWSMIRSKISSFPAPTSGRGNECLTKSEIVSMGGENLRINGSYGNNECVMLDDILANVITWEYTFNVSPISLSFDAIGGTKSVSVTSYKRKYINGSYTGVQEGVGNSSSVSGTGFSSEGTAVTASENTGTSQRRGTFTFTQYESGRILKLPLSQEIFIEATYRIRVKTNTSGVHFNGTLIPGNGIYTDWITVGKYSCRFDGTELLNQSGEDLVIQIWFEYDRSDSLIDYLSKSTGMLSTAVKYDIDTITVSNMDAVEDNAYITLVLGNQSGYLDGDEYVIYFYR